jgi:hypothetical protein
MNEAKRRELFAYQLLKEPGEVFKAGFAAFPEGTPEAHALAMQAATEWPSEDEMIELKTELVAKHGEAHFLPSKGDLAREVYKIVKDGRTNMDKLSAAKVYAEIMGFIEKPGPAVQLNQTNVTNKVMVVPMAPTNEDWETKAMTAQNKLFAAASG